MSGVKLKLLVVMLFFFVVWPCALSAARVEVDASNNKTFRVCSLFLHCLLQLLLFASRPSSLKQ